METVCVISAVADVGEGVTVGVWGGLVGRDVWVGRTTQDDGARLMLSKVGSGVRVGSGLARRWLASRLNAVLKMI
jgi:hypothetical protein